MVAPNLESQPTSFIGRQGELIEIDRLLADPACRLLTLVGPGGIGKTRLALEAARTQQFVFDDGVYFIALQALSSLDFIVPTIAEAVGFQFYPGGEPKQQLFEHLREQSLLLVLDNFEHLLDGVGLVSDLLAHAPTLKVLATSRERLNLVEEWAFKVEGLPVPASETATQIDAYGAVQLFLQNAQRVQVGFKLTETQIPAVTRICRLVGGIPLGIELAAAWVRALSCEEIAAEIERGLDILTTPARNVPSRHRTMRAVLEQSWNRLSDEERDVFMRLSVFRGGFRKEAAQEIAGATLQILSTLVDKSLARADASGRYDLHELLRQYGQEKLEEVAEVREQTLDLHSAYYAEFVGQRERDLSGSRVMIATYEIEAEIDNIRQAWERAATHARAAELERYLWSLLHFYEIQGRMLEAEESFEKAAQAYTLATVHQGPDRILGQLYARQAWFSTRLGDYEKAKSLLLTSLTILSDPETRREMAFSLVSLGAVCIYRGEYVEAEVVLKEAEAIYRAQGNPIELAWVLDNQAKLLRAHGDYDRARETIQEVIGLSKKAGQTVWRIESLLQSGQIMESLAKYEEARQIYDEAAVICQGLPWSLVVASTTIAQASAAQALHQEDEAAFYYHKTLEISKHVGSVRFMLDALLGIVELQLNQNSVERSVELLALVLYHPASRSQARNRVQALLAGLESQLSPNVFDVYKEKGKTANLDEVLQSLYRNPLFAGLRGVDINAPYLAHSPSSASGDGSTDTLTTRELEILQLMAQGLSNREIARQLILSVGTVKWYGSQICSKLHTQNRVRAIARARELNILH